MQYWTKKRKKYRIERKGAICQLSAGFMVNNGKKCEKKRKKERSKERNKRRYMYKRRKKKKMGAIVALLRRLA